MQLLVASSNEQALEFNERAFAHVRQASRAKGAGWSDVFVDYGTSLRYAILYTGEIADAFTTEELAGVEEGERIIRNEQGQFVSGNWEPVPPPESESEE